MPGLEEVKGFVGEGRKGTEPATKPRHKQEPERVIDMAAQVHADQHAEDDTTDGIGRKGRPREEGTVWRKYFGYTKPDEAAKPAAEENQ